MKSLHVPFYLLIAVLIVACNKKDYVDKSSTTDAVTSTSADSTNWISLSQWNTANQENFNVYYSSIADKNITATDADNGLVLVFMKSNADNFVVRLPFQDKNGDRNLYWYYQVTEGNILISCDDNGTKKTLNNQNAFKYIISSTDNLKKLEEKGFTRLQLLQMSYDEAKKAVASANS